jgi:AraC-like DNA-binding protein
MYRVMLIDDRVVDPAKLKLMLDSKNAGYITLGGQDLQWRLTMRDALGALLKGRASKEELSFLQSMGMTQRFALAFIPVKLCNIGEDERSRALLWEADIVERFAQALFPHFCLLNRGGDSYVLYIWDTSRQTWEKNCGVFRKSLIKSSASLTKAGVEVLRSVWFQTLDSREAPCRELESLVERYKLAGLGGNSEAAHKARDFIITHLDVKLSLELIAKQVNISPGYLSTLFRKAYHRTLKDFINEERINRACEMLREHKYRINEIAYQLGYDSPNYMSRVFHRYTGLSLSEYEGRLRVKDGTPYDSP